MFNVIAFGIVLLDGWGMIGNWTTKFGFHNVWEVWVRFTHGCALMVLFGLYLRPNLGLPSLLWPVNLPLV